MLTIEHVAFTIVLTADHNAVEARVSRWHTGPPSKSESVACNWSERLQTHRYDRKITITVTSAYSLRPSTRELQSMCRHFLSPEQTQFQTLTTYEMEQQAYGRPIFPTIPYDHIAPYPGIYQSLPGDYAL